MNHVEFRTDATTIPEDKIRRITQQLLPITSQLKDAMTDESYRSAYAFIHTPFDTSTIEAVEQFAPLKNTNPDIIILIGIGGSNLATLAIIEALYGHLQHPPTMPALYTADTVNDRLTNDLLQQTERWLLEGKNVILLITSKSGKTLETLVNAALFIDVLRKHSIDYQQKIVILSEQNSPLHTYAQEENIPFLAVPATVPGRYSVFTSTHLLPLYLMNIDIRALCAGAHTSVFDAAAQNAAILYYAWNQGIVIHDLFIFDPYLETLGKWYRQLLAESIGKRTSLSDKKIEVGITPTISIGSTDLHSVAQLYLAGPHNRLITFMYHTPHQEGASINHDYSFLPSYAQHTTVNKIEHAIIKGTIEAFKNEERPYITLECKEIIPETVGEILYFMMAQMVYLGALFNINPFDQPEVELYKTLTKKCLEHE